MALKGLTGKTTPMFCYYAYAAYVGTETLGLFLCVVRRDFCPYVLRTIGISFALQEYSTDFDEIGGR